MEFSRFETDPYDGETVGDVAYRRIRSDIVNGRLKPSEKLKLDALRRWLGAAPDPLPPFTPIVPQPPTPEPLAECEAHAKAMCESAVGYDSCHKCVWSHASDLEEEGCDFDGQHSAIVAFACGSPPAIELRTWSVGEGSRA